MLLFLRPLPGVAQSGSSATKVLMEQRAVFLRHLKNYTSGDSVLNNRLSRTIELKTDSIYSFIRSDAALLTSAEKEKAIRSLAYFINGIDKSISQQKIEMYDISGALESYKNILKALFYHKPLIDVLMPLGPQRTQLLATAFSQYKEYQFLDDMAVYKRLASSPELILHFLGNKPSFRFADSLLLAAAVHDPFKIINYLKDGNPVLQKNIRNTKNMYLQQIVSLSGDRNASELLPFTTQLADKEITADTILETRMDVVKYFQLLVNTLRGSVESKNTSLNFQKLIRNGIKKKALLFYVNEVNDLHSATDAKRFASVRRLRPEDLYYIITSCEDELYTSSYLGLYKRLMEHFKTSSADSLFSIVQYDNFRIFMRVAANYNVLTDFLNKMPLESAAGLLKRFISGIESDTNSGLEKAMDIADSFTGLDSVEIIELFAKELQSNLTRCQSGQLYYGIRLYSILIRVFDLVKQKNDLNKLWATLGNYEILKRNALQNKNREIIQLVVFYGDEDGVTSFNNFQNFFSDTSKWEISKNASWITIRSLSEEPVIIYANMPLDNEEEMDIRAQDSLVAFLDQQSLEPTILIHRGHSYHLGNTLKRLRPSVKLAILGSCGGYNSAISIASINPDIQIIGSKKMGTKYINDPMIDAINETLLNKSDLYWPGIWDDLAARFSKDELTLNVFNEYIPPGKNVSLFVLKLFNSNSGFF